MSRANNSCKNCKYCKQLCLKGAFSFWECNKWYCAHFNKIINAESVCDNWQKEKRHYDLSAERFDNVIKDIEWLISAEKSQQI